MQFYSHKLHNDNSAHDRCQREPPTCLRDVATMQTRVHGSAVTVVGTSPRDHWSWPHPGIILAIVMLESSALASP